MAMPALPVYADGSYCPKTGAGGWGAIVPVAQLEPGYEWASFSGQCDVADNNAAESYAVQQACNALLASGLAKGRHVRVYSDTSVEMTVFLSGWVEQAGALSAELAYTPAHRGGRNSQTASNGMVDRLAKAAMRDYREQLLS